MVHKFFNDGFITYKTTLFTMEPWLCLTCSLSDGSHTDVLNDGLFTRERKQKLSVLLKARSETDSFIFFKFYWSRKLQSQTRFKEMGNKLCLLMWGAAYTCREGRNGWQLLSEDIYSTLSPDHMINDPLIWKIHSLHVHIEYLYVLQSLSMRFEWVPVSSYLCQNWRYTCATPQDQRSVT